LPSGYLQTDAWESLRSLFAYFEGGPEFLRLMLVLSLERRDGDPTVLEAARRVRITAAEGLAVAYRRAFSMGESVREQAVADELARFTLMLLDGVFIASQIEPDETNLKRAFDVISTSVRATGEQLLLAARAADAAS